MQRNYSTCNPPTSTNAVTEEDASAAEAETVETRTEDADGTEREVPQPIETATEVLATEATVNEANPVTVIKKADVTEIETAPDNAANRAIDHDHLRHHQSPTTNAKNCKRLC